MSNKKIIVTGGAGYIGSHTAKELYMSGYEPFVIDNFSTGHEWAIKWGDYAKIDLSDKSELIKIVKKINPDAVVHFAASSLVGISYSNPIEYFNNNIVNTLNLLEAMNITKVNKFVFSSSCAVYGIPDKTPILDTDKTNPISPYGESKLIIEKILRWYSEIYNLKYMSLRYFNAAGADSDNELGECHELETHLIPLALDVALGNKDCLEIFGSDYPTKDGTAIRDYIHVKDLAIAHVKALKYIDEKERSDLINLGAGKGYSVNEIINCINNVTGKEIKKINKNRRIGDPSVLIADTKKVKSLLNWEPKHSELKNIIETAYKWKKSNL